MFDTTRRRGISDTSLGSANVIYLGLLLEAPSQQQAEEFIATLVAVEPSGARSTSVSRTGRTPLLAGCSHVIRSSVVGGEAHDRPA
ncbi:hypothetical protein ACWD7F_35315 [Streptomyces sp. NPDC005122]